MIGRALQSQQGRAHSRRARETQRRSARKFDLKRFHEVLKEGAMPLTMLEKRIKELMAPAEA